MYNLQNQGGRKRLPKFKFSAKIPIGLHVILQIQIKNSKMTAILCEKLFWPKIRRGSTLNPSWNNVKWILFVNYTVTVALVGVAKLNLALPAPSLFKTRGGRKRLPKFKFSAKFPIGLHVILQIQIKKFENDCYLMWKIILTENPSRFNVEPLLK